MLSNAPTIARPSSRPGTRSGGSGDRTRSREIRSWVLRSGNSGGCDGRRAQDDLAFLFKLGDVAGQL
jgi:hypothetical protein